MSPTLAPGDYLIITKARTLRSGFVVLVDHPKYGTIVKRVKTVNPNSVHLEGDSPESTGSEDMGAIPQDLIKGRVRWAIIPKGLKRL